MGLPGLLGRVGYVDQGCAGACEALPGQSASEAATSAADLLSRPSAWISRAPAAAFRSERFRFRAVWAWLWGLFRPAASLPATASPRSRMSLMITFGFASTRSAQEKTCRPSAAGRSCAASIPGERHWSDRRGDECRAGRAGSALSVAFRRVRAPTPTHKPLA